MDADSYEEVALNTTSVAAESSTAPKAPQTDSGMVGSDGKPISKSAMKKAARMARAEVFKPIRRKEEKERRRAKHAMLSEKYSNGTLTPEEKEQFEQTKLMKKEKKRAKRRFDEKEDDNGGDDSSGEIWKGGVVIDLSFDELMTDQEISSMSSQLSYVYSCNRLAQRPISSILHTSFSPKSSPRLWEKMTKTNWDRWTRCYWWSEDVGGMNAKLSEPTVSEDTEHAGQDLERFLSDPVIPPSLGKGHTLIYLSADAEEELETLREDEVYVIGGIVDRNRYKNLCQGKAEKLGIRTARLPIGTYLSNLPTRKVLTVNQVFAILVEFIARQDWAAAFEAVIPQRKYLDTKRKRSKNGGDMDEDGENNGEVDTMQDAQDDIEDEEAALNMG